MSRITIDAIGGLGDGIARLDGKPVFVAKSCAGDDLSITIVNQTKDAIRAHIAEIHKGGSARINAPCKHYDFCGGCSLQHINDDTYRAFKRGVLTNALAHSGFPEAQAEMVFLPPATRRRAEFKVKRDKKQLTLSYHGLRSHNLVAIDNCPILLPELQKLLPALTSALNTLPYIDNITGVSMTAADSGIDVLLSFSHPYKDMALLTALCDRLKLARLSVCVGDGAPFIVQEPIPVEMQLGDYRVGLTPDAFLQAASEAQKQLTNFVLKHVSQSRYAVDLFCGIGTYAMPVSKLARVHAVDIHGESMRHLRTAIGRYELDSRISCTPRDLFKDPLSSDELNTYDIAILNPPRAGAKLQVEAIASSKLKRVVMISCNPASFARDAKALKAAGFVLDDVMGLDQFVWSPHLEIAASFTR